MPIPRNRDGSEFCCAGCEAVHELMVGHGLANFYALGGGKGQPIGLVPRPAAREWLPELEARGRISDKHTRVRLDVQGIHCAACVWVIQELWRRCPGALDMHLNPALGQATLVYDHGELDLQSYLDDVEALGYRFAPAAKSVRKAQRGLLYRLGICVALSLNAMMFAFAGYLGLDETGGSTHTLFTWLGFGIATLSVLIGGPVFFRAALQGLSRRVLHLDLPISLGILLAYGGSTWQFFAGSAATSYFDTVTIFVALMLLGRYLQQRALDRNRDYLLADEGAKNLRARRLVEDTLELVPVTEVRASDELLLVPGDLVPVPCHLVGEGAVQFSLDWINGESEPRSFGPGETVPAGAFLRSRQSHRLVAESDAESSPLLQMLEDQRHRRTEADLRGRGGFWLWLNRSYVALVLLLAVCAATAWILVDATRAIEVTVAVLVVTCPCALGLATPLAIELTTAGLRRVGIFPRTDNLLEKARHVRKVVFDKTGTLTWGTLRATPLAPVPDLSRDALLTMAAQSNHPVSQAILETLGADGFDFLANLAVEELPGAGLRGRAGEDLFELGARDGTSTFLRNGQVEARFAISEDLRDGFQDEVRDLRDLECDVFLLSGDRQSKVDRVAQAMNVPGDHAFGERSPEQKADLVRGLDAGDTMMVGDGLNDTPAFEAAFCAGAAALDRPAIVDRADFFFLGGAGSAVSRVIAASERLHRVVSTNLWLAGAYNAVALSFAFAGWMTPVLCAVLMPLSSLVLIAHTGARLGNDTHRRRVA